ncbi:response regulator [Stappia sp. GBMRC 2046]|uniref:Response regulator n=1 Tax=Stappia sediminis TaxID=2692190 RepID=A0A7X3SA47_9HYPH|nr:response regulator transcription factor [Stappia sediminis]MXN67440.1 response regulator [Stappia sediminis]
MTEKKIRTVVVDDHPLVVAGARALIEASEDIVCVGDANTGADAEALIKEVKPDVVVLDVSLPDVNGLVLAEKLLDGGFKGHIVMMTLYEERTFVQKALHIGAKGFIQKRSADQNLLLAIRSAMLGGLFLDPPTARDVMAPTAEDGADFSHSNSELGLTEREEYVLKMVALGYANKEIAARANVSIKSIETYKARATEKLKLHSRAQIVRFAVRHGWMNLPDAGEPTLPS